MACNPPPTHITVREGYVPGCIGRIAQLHANHYSAANGFGVGFEAKVARELADFCQNYKPGRDGIWLAQCNGHIEGSVAIDGTDAGSTGAHLRWFITSNEIKGQGIGRMLLEQAIVFVRACGYRNTYLWTFSGLDAARHLYDRITSVSSTKARAANGEALLPSSDSNAARPRHSLSRRSDTMATVRDGNKGVLIVVDMQVGVVKSAWEAPRVVRNVARAVERARGMGVPVIWVQHSDDDLPYASPDRQWAPELVPAAGEPLIHKHFNSSFEQTAALDDGTRIEASSVIDELNIAMTLVKAYPGRKSSTAKAEEASFSGPTGSAPP